MKFLALEYCADFQMPKVKKAKRGKHLKTLKWKRGMKGQGKNTATPLKLDSLKARGTTNSRYEFLVGELSVQNVTWNMVDQIRLDQIRLDQIRLDQIRLDQTRLDDGLFLCTGIYDECDSCN